MWLTRKHLIMVLISLELMLLAININFIIYSVIMDDMMGQLYAIILLALAATENSFRFSHSSSILQVTRRY